MPRTITTALAALIALTTLAACEAEHRAEPWRALGGEADGDLSGPVSPYSDVPAVSRLDPELRAALRRAARDAAEDGIEITVTSGWRSAAYQESLLDDAVRKYGSREEARRWVSTPERSTHVTGDAVDIGPTDAASWMDRYGARHGLCRTYANEIWHYELAVEPGGQCPPSRPDATA